ncbi:MAG: right-handed parallel beta-helix repeat-containing protein [Anaerolineae bacterium]|nr:right-handed parallel beta-helix repeat-containing protein [Anaerolineae bacterium]
MSVSSGSTEARDKLGEILTHYGRSVLDDPRRCEALLRDLLPDHRREVHLLVAALRERVPADLLASNNGVPQSLLLAQLAQRLHDHLGIAPAFAGWAVETWAVALGVMVPPPPKRARTPKTVSAAQADPPAKAAPQPKAARTTKAATGTKPTARTATVTKTTAQGSGAKGGRSKRASPTPPSPPAPRLQLIVGLTGRADYRTLREAIQNVAPNGRILVQPGIYRESLTLDRAVEIIGNGRAGETVIESLTSPCVQSTSPQATLRNLTLTRQGARDQGVAVDVTAGQLTLDDCRIAGEGRACIAVGSPKANLAGRRCHILDGSHTGVLFYDRATGVLEDCEVGRMGQNGVQITQGANPTLNRVRVHGCEVGVLVMEQGRGLLEDCDIVDNQYQGVMIVAGAPTLLRCRVQRNLDGIWVERGGGGSVEECDLSGNRRGAWYVKSGVVRHRGNRE